MMGPEPSVSLSTCSPSTNSDSVRLFSVAYQTRSGKVVSHPGALPGLFIDQDDIDGCNHDHGPAPSFSAPENGSTVKGHHSAPTLLHCTRLAMLTSCIAIERVSRCQGRGAFTFTATESYFRLRANNRLKQSSKHGRLNVHDDPLYKTIPTSSNAGCKMKRNGIISRMRPRRYVAAAN
ncbi:hypothetical protein OUZ56_002911 [Daphnia magna]|uniref:Uncharacterized protein n=1 Tax=Daphnia magna TaxID=35525 RepID=A0ABR0A762_9CRUS|nr:hypothetical protein OUZ56_002911 [Daphnia magna]